MPQLIGFLFVGIGAWIGYKVYARAVEHLSELKAAEAEIRRRANVREKDLGALEYDPISGVYRPARRNI